MNDYEVCVLKPDERGKHGEWEWSETIRDTSRRRVMAKLRKNAAVIEGTVRVRKLS